MTVDSQIARILRLYPDDCQPHTALPVKSADSFSGAGLWRLTTPRGDLCLRKGTPEHPTPERLEFIQAVLWHANQEGFERIGVPIETNHHHGYVRHDGCLWELAPWLSGEADYRSSPSFSRLRNALRTIAEFHRAVSSFPLPEPGPVHSPGMIERANRLRGWLAGGARELSGEIERQTRSPISSLALQALNLFAAAAPAHLPLVERAAAISVSLQPCIRDIWSAHVLYLGDEVSGLVDFTAMRAENVAADIARLLGSMAGDNRLDWQRGLEAYQAVRLLSDAELQLVEAFDRANVLAAPLQWIEWIFVEQRQFERPQAVLDRFEELLARLIRLATK